MNRRLTITARQPLLAYLFDALGLKRGAVKNLLKFGAVSVNGATVRQFDYRLSPGDEVTIGNLQAAAAVGRLEQRRIQPVFEDDSLVVVDKPPGLLTVATDRENADTLYVRLNDYLSGRGSDRTTRALVVHRLDQATSGLVLFAKSESMKRQLHDVWPAVDKIYLAVVEGCPDADEGRVANYLSEDAKSLKVSGNDRRVEGSRLAISHYRVIRACADVSLVEVRLETGRKHQIRVHLASLGCPVVGDRRYGHRSDTCDRLALHASGLHLAHPVTGQPLHFTSSLPKALGELLP